MGYEIQLTCCISLLDHVCLFGTGIQISSRYTAMTRSTTDLQSSAGSSNFSFMFVKRFLRMHNQIYSAIGGVCNNDGEVKDI